MIFIKSTLDETRKAVKSAEDAVEVTRAIGQAQVRSHLMTTKTKVTVITPHSGGSYSRSFHTKFWG
jgi:hypothetical protein